MYRELESARLRLIRLLSGIGTLLVLSVWLGQMALGVVTPIHAYAFPLLVLLNASCWLGVTLAPRHSRAVMVAFYAAFCLYFLVTLYLMLMDSAQYGLRIANTLLYLPLLSVLSFVFAPMRLALVASLTALGAILGMVGLFAVLHGFADVPRTVLYLLANAIIVQAVVLVCLALVGRMEQQFRRLTRRAEALQAEAFTDPLTGVLNRRGMVEGVAALAAEGGAVILFDVDAFKAINDDFGHAVGDEILVAVAGDIGGQLRTGDVLGRWGGEEFVVVLPGCGRAVAGAVAERVRVAVEERVGIGVPTVGRPVTVSAGVAEWPQDADFSHVLDRADAALYRAKLAGRNRVYLAGAARAAPQEARA